MASSTTSGLNELTPIPIELNEEKNGSFVPHSPSPILKKVLRFFLKVQKYSAYTFLGFLGLHVSSVVVVPGIGVPIPIAQDVFEMARAVYQSIPGYEQTAVVGAVSLHVLSGIGIRFIREKLEKDRVVKKGKVFEPVIKDTSREDIGLGGITALLGLGYKKSWISTHFPSLTPLSFSGYVLFPLLGYHYFKMKCLPTIIDGDSSLITLDYITYYLNYSPISKIGNVVNYFALGSLLWVMAYHATSGILRFHGKHSLSAKKAAYALINGTSLLGLFSIIRFGREKVNVLDFPGTQFIRYLHSSYV